MVKVNVEFVDDRHFPGLEATMHKKRLMKMGLRVG